MQEPASSTHPVRNWRQWFFPNPFGISQKARGRDVLSQGRDVLSQGRDIKVTKIGGGVTFCHKGVTFCRNLAMQKLLKTFSKLWGGVKGRDVLSQSCDQKK